VASGAGEGHGLSGRTRRDSRWQHQGQHGEKEMANALVALHQNFLRLKPRPSGRFKIEPAFAVLSRIAMS
jgi:hypothetical protein